jgi:Kef-type K+ transport system membrane component KefB
MKPLEIVAFIILLLMGVPDLCRLLRRPALVFPLYVVIGMIAGFFCAPSSVTLVQQVGTFGFVLLLFLIGLEIELPDRRQGLAALAHAGRWIAIQLPILAGIGLLLKGKTAESILAASALSGCSVSMAYAAWQNFPHANEQAKQKALLGMVALEILAIFLIAGADVAVEDGFSWWALLRIAGTLVAFVLVAYTADHVTRGLTKLLSFTTRWKVHFIVLIVFAVAAIGDRLGLSAPKTAFCLGLFVSGATKRGLEIEHHLEPIGKKFLIPVFFVGLGSMVPLTAFFHWTGLWALLTAAFILGLRDTLYRRIWQKVLPGPRNTFLLACPNLTMAGVAATSLLGVHHGSSPVLEWLLMTSLFLSVASVLLLPPTPPIEGLPSMPEPAKEAKDMLPSPHLPWGRVKT